VSVGVALALAVAAVVVGLVVAPKSSTVRLRPARDVPTLSETPGRYENVATAYVEPAWWPTSLRSPMEARGIGSSPEQGGWLILRNGSVIAVGTLERGDAQLDDDPAGQTVVADPTDGAVHSASIQLDAHTVLRVSSNQLSSSDVLSLTSTFDRTSHTFPAAASSGLVATPDPDAWLARMAGGPGVFTTVTKWSGRASTDHQLSVGGRTVSDAPAQVTAIGQYAPGSTVTKVGSTPAVLLPAVDGRAQLFWAISPTVLGMVDGRGMSTADLLHTARSTAVVTRSWWWSVRHRKSTKRTVHGFGIADTEAYLASGTLGRYRWLMTRNMDGLLLTYTDAAHHYLGAIGKIDTAHQPVGSLGIGGSDQYAEISLNLAHGAHDLRVTINGADVPSALFHLPGTDVDMVMAIGKDPSYDPKTTDGTTPPATPVGHATVTATLPDGSPYAASI
jgi:hypothetical protein